MCFTQDTGKIVQKGLILDEETLNDKKAQMGRNIMNISRDKQNHLQKE